MAGCPPVPPGRWASERGPAPSPGSLSELYTPIQQITIKTCSVNVCGIGGLNGHRLSGFYHVKKAYFISLPQPQP